VPIKLLYKGLVEGEDYMILEGKVLPLVIYRTPIDYCVHDVQCCSDCPSCCLYEWRDNPFLERESKSVLEEAVARTKQNEI